MHRRFEPVQSQDVEIVSVNLTDDKEIVLGVREKPTRNSESTYLTLSDTNALRLAGDILDLFNGVRKIRVD